MITADEWMGMYHIAADRADKAEAEVERLKPIEEFADKNFKLWENAAYTMNAKLQAENAKLRKVVEAARVDRGRCNECCHHGRHCNLYKVCEALEVLDKEGER